MPTSTLQNAESSISKKSISSRLLAVLLSPFGTLHRPSIIKASPLSADLRTASATNNTQRSSKQTPLQASCLPQTTYSRLGDNSAQQSPTHTPMHAQNFSQQSNFGVLASDGNVGHRHQAWGVPQYNDPTAG
jgi:hypothetical protein